MRVVEARNRRALGVAAHCNKTTLADRHRSGFRLCTVNRMKLTVEQNQLDTHGDTFGGSFKGTGRTGEVQRGKHRFGAGWLYRQSSDHFPCECFAEAFNQGANKRVAAGIRTYTTSKTMVTVTSAVLTK